MGRGTGQWRDRGVPLQFMPKSQTRSSASSGQQLLVRTHLMMKGIKEEKVHPPHGWEGERKRFIRAMNLSLPVEKMTRTGPRTSRSKRRTVYGEGDATSRVESVITRRSAHQQQEPEPTVQRKDNVALVMSRMTYATMTTKVPLRPREFAVPMNNPSSPRVMIPQSRPQTVPVRNVVVRDSDIGAWDMENDKESPSNEASPLPLGEDVTVTTRKDSDRDISVTFPHPPPSFLPSVKKNKTTTRRNSTEEHVRKGRTRRKRINVSIPVIPEKSTHAADARKSVVRVAPPLPLPVHILGNDVPLPLTRRNYLKSSPRRQRSTDSSFSPHLHLSVTTTPSRTPPFLTPSPPQRDNSNVVYIPSGTLNNRNLRRQSSCFPGRGRRVSPERRVEKEERVYVQRMVEGKNFGLIPC